MNKELLNRLQLLSMHAPKGSHNRVAEKLGMSMSMLNQIKAGYNFKDPKEGDEKVRMVIAEYEKVIRKRIQTLQKLIA